MVGKVNKKYTVADVYAEATKMLKNEMQELQKRPLKPSEELKVAELAKALSKSVLKEMNVV